MSSPDAATPRKEPKLLAREDQIAQWREERDAIKADGEDLAHRVRFLDTERASQKTLDTLRQEVKDWLDRLDAHRALWYSGISSMQRLTESIGAGFFFTPVPGPSWRAQWVTSIEAGLAWLEGHDLKEA